MFETKYINELISKIETNHNDTFFNVFLKLVSQTQITGSGASEYEIYFNYMLINHNDKINIRFLKWQNMKYTIDNNLDNGDLDYVSYHWYL
jgi:hypothetical protein